MTLIEPKSSRDAHDSAGSRGLVQWTIVQAGLWVGKSNGEFAGMIESHPDGGFVAMSKLAGPLGTFATVDEAKARFTA